MLRTSRPRVLPGPAALALRAARAVLTARLGLAVAATLALAGGCGAKAVGPGAKDLGVNADFIVAYDFLPAAPDDGGGPAPDLVPTTSGDDGGPGVPDLAHAGMTDGAAPAPDLAVVAGPDLAAPAPDLLAPPPPDLLLADFAGADLACAKPCNAPPAAACEANVVRTYQAGSCQAGACVYPSTTTTCPKGCYAAACVNDAFGDIPFGQAYVSTSGAQIPSTGGTAPATDTVTVVTRTLPPGGAKTVTLVYAVNDPTFGKAATAMVTFTLDGNQPVQGQQQWFALIPKQAKGSHVYWYIAALGYDGTTHYYSNFSQNFDYTTT